MHNTGATGALSPNASASYGTSAVNAGYTSASSVQNIAVAANSCTPRVSGYEELRIWAGG